MRRKTYDKIIKLIDEMDDLVTKMHRMMAYILVTEVEEVDNDHNSDI